MTVPLAAPSAYMKWSSEPINTIGGIAEASPRSSSSNKKREIKNKPCEINYEYEMIIFSGNGGLQAHHTFK